ncbi:MAG: hypothetical protein ACI9JL_004519 [Paracoccaceae bacterium]|jgi:hypothetical protein
MGVILFPPRNSKYLPTVVGRAARMLVLALGVTLSGAVLVTASSAKAETLAPETRSALFSGLQSYLARHTNKGVFILMNDPTVDPVDIRLKNLHPLVLKKNDVYMLCADFVATGGRNFLIDFFLKPVAGKPGEFRMLYYVVGNRSRFMRLFERSI